MANIPTNHEVEIIKALRGKRSLRIFAAYLNVLIPPTLPSARTSFVTAGAWVNGKQRVSDACLLAWQIYYADNDPRRVAALAIIGIRNKEKK